MARLPITISLFHLAFFAPLATAPAFAAESDSGTKVAASQAGGAGGSAGLLGGGARPKPKPHHKSVHHSKQ